MRSILIVSFLFATISGELGFDRFRPKHRQFVQTLTEDASEDAADTFTTEWFTQRLDHSDPTNHQTWQQRYFLDDRYSKKSNRSIAFLLIGEESSISTGYMTKHATWTELASEFGALAIQLEHRYYGESQPFNDTTLESFKYFSSEQAVADIANFIQNFSSTLQHPPEWIVFGGSYAGSLAAWLKLKHPNLIKGVISAGAPLVAKVDFPEAYEQTSRDLKAVSTECNDIVVKGFEQIETLLKSSEGQKQLFTLFKLCVPLEDNDKNILLFIDQLAILYVSVAQNNKVNAMGFTPERKNFTLDSVCEILTNKTHNKTEVERLADFNNYMEDKFYSGECLFNNYSEYIDFYQDTSDVTTGRVWKFQTCNEFGWFQNPDTVFGTKNITDFKVELCQDFFGPTFNKSNVEGKILKTNTLYGGLSNVIDNIVYVNGEEDPWSTISLTHSNNPLAPAILINGTSHCAVVYPADKSDPPQLVEARKEIKRLIKQWLS